MTEACLLVACVLIFFFNLYCISLVAIRVYMGLIGETAFIRNQLLIPLKQSPGFFFFSEKKPAKSHTDMDKL